jgi:hypothetical protein
LIAIAMGGTNMVRFIMGKLPGFAIVVPDVCYAVWLRFF